MADYIRYANQDATRNQPLSNRLVQALGFLQPMGVTAEVFSGGQPATGPNRVGSHRHDHGNAGDVRFFRGGRALSWANPNDVPIFQSIVEQGRAAGITGFGAGRGYMDEGTMHLGFGSPSVWGAGGRRANAPNWLRSAFAGSINGGGGSDALIGGTGNDVTLRPGRIGGDSMVARDFDAQTSSMAAPSFGSMSPKAGTPTEPPDDGEQLTVWDRLGIVADALKNSTPPVPSAGGWSGGGGRLNQLLEVLTSPTVGDLQLRRRLGAGR